MYHDYIHKILFFRLYFRKSSPLCVNNQFSCCNFKVRLGAEDGVNQAYVCQKMLAFFS